MLKSFVILVLVFLVPFLIMYFQPENISSRRYDMERKREKERELTEELKKEKEEAERRMKLEQQERLEQIKKRKEEEIQAFSELRSEIEKMPISQKWKQNVREKCGNKCQICGFIGKTQIHHRDSFYLILKHNYITSKEEAFECKQLWDLNNGEVLCKECHDKMESSKYRRLRI